MEKMESKFLNKLEARHIGGKWWELTAPLMYYSVLLDTIITVPIGFVTDFASVPRLPIAYLFFAGRSKRPACIHDSLYRSGQCSKRMADEVFLEAMVFDIYEEEEDNSFLKNIFKKPINFIGKHIMYWFVRGFGRWSYKEIPGCLDYRKCPFNRNISECKKCRYFSQEYYDLTIKQE